MAISVGDVLNKVLTYLSQSLPKDCILKLDPERKLIRESRWAPIMDFPQDIVMRRKEDGRRLFPFKWKVPLPFWDMHHEPHVLIENTVYYWGFVTTLLFYLMLWLLILKYIKSGLEESFTFCGNQELFQIARADIKKLCLSMFPMLPRLNGSADRI